MWSLYILSSPLVTGISGAIFRGYRTLDEAEAAYEYALDQGWVGDATTEPQSIPSPRPLHLGRTFDINPLHGSDPGDDRWFVVYRGILPGVYRSHLECQLNTLCVSGAVHESVVTKSEALVKYAEAVQRGDVASLPGRQI
ncbi:hypothetical protein R3P38DRAFT_2792515 [Favolaschia claudopus]|uniref:Ribonuclease H1 N-terminal domain-containing protein n=1 Tax=Favolaschia claudopus TaxID=2862362 RepID=A0AAW0AFG5_9AGAR